jgi:iron complex transport system substrate-binding protein
MADPDAGAAGRARTPVRRRQHSRLARRAAALAIGLALAAGLGARQQPRRVISLVPAVTEMLFAIGAGDAVVGVSTYDRFPPEVASRPRVGALVDPDFERILSLRPDLVIVYGTQDELMARLARAKIPVFRYVHAGLADVTKTLIAVGERVGRAEQARAAARQIERDLDDVRRRVAGRARPATAIIFDREPGALRGMFASGGIGFLHDLLDVAGGRNVFADVQRQSLQASTELLLARRPEVIVELFPQAGWSGTRAAREREVWAALSALPAVQANRVHLLADDRLAVPGPRVAESARVLAQVLHPRTPQASGPGPRSAAGQSSRGGLQ